MNNDVITRTSRYLGHLALDDDDATLVVHCDATRVLQNIGAKFAHKLSVLVVDLYLRIRTT